MQFRDNLKRLRKLRNLSQEELAEKMRVSRQSVSKWETGDAYPEMSNILELCRIFHCRINDLVNDSIIDVDSLDEEIKTSVVKFKSEQQSKMKNISKAMVIIAKAGKIACLICLPLVVIVMVAAGIITSQAEITDEGIFWQDNKVVSITEAGEKISFNLGGANVADITNQGKIATVKEVLRNNSKIALTLYIEAGLATLFVTLVLTSMVLQTLEKLFKNIHNNDTPFTLENVMYIKRMAYLLIITTILPNVAGALFELILQTDLDISFELTGLVEILFLFGIAYVFQYGYAIQLDSKGKMYGTENE